MLVSLSIPPGLLREEAFRHSRRGSLTYWNTPSLSPNLLTTLYYNDQLPVCVPLERGRDQLLHIYVSPELAECLAYSSCSLNTICWTKEYLESLKLPISQSWKTELSKSLFRKQRQSRLKPRLSLKRSLWAWGQGPCLVDTRIPGLRTGPLSKYWWNWH